MGAKSCEKSLETFALDHNPAIWSKSLQTFLATEVARKVARRKLYRFGCPCYCQILVDCSLGSHNPDGETSPCKRDTLQGFHGRLTELRTSVRIGEDLKRVHEVYRDINWQCRRFVGYLQIECHTNWWDALGACVSCGVCREGAACSLLVGLWGVPDFFNLNQHASAFHQSRAQNFLRPIMSVQQK